jgi:hypothetical protein
MKSRHLVVYDYGTGRVWAYVTARSADEIVSRFPELQVVHERPEWMSDEDEQGLDVLDVDAPTGLLSDLLAGRSN